MIEKQFQRTERLIGRENLIKLKSKKVLVIGVGGVGGFTCEALARAGIGQIDIVDKDKVDVTNINRQIIATHNTVGLNKVDVMKERMSSINPEIVCNGYNMFYLPEFAEDLDFSKYDYIVDAVDNVTAKLDIISRAKGSGIPVISAMGAGNKMDPLAFKVSDIEKTKGCPLAKVIRKELRKRGINGVKVVFSEEEPIKQIDEDGNTLRVPASISFVPSVCGLILAGEVIKDLIK